jgi:hypothetical protein
VPSRSANSFWVRPRFSLKTWISIARRMLRPAFS